MSFTKKDRKLYDKELKLSQRRNKRIALILDTDEEHSNWLNKIPKKKKKK